MQFYILQFCPLSDPVKRDTILEQFSVITRPYPRVNGIIFYREGTAKFMGRTQFSFCCSEGGDHVFPYLIFAKK